MSKIYLGFLTRDLRGKMEEINCIKKMIDSLGHEIEVCSENGSYTIFNIYFYDISDYLSLDS